MIARLLFENPFPLYLVLGFVELALVTWWWSRRTRAATVALVIPPLVGVLVGVLAHAVVTDREQIIQNVEQIADAVEQQQFAEVVAYLDEDFQARIGGVTLSRETVEMFSHQQVDRFDITHIKIVDPQVEVQDSLATMKVGTSLFRGEAGEFKTYLAWRLRWIRRGDRWLILDVDEPRQEVPFR